MIRKWTPESDEPKPGEASNVQQLRAWFERLPKMRARICQQQEHIASLRNAATTTTSGTSGAPGRSGTSDKVGRNSDAAMDAEQIGVASMLLGAGRDKKGDPIDPAAGICLHKKTGQPVEAGEPLCTLYTNRPETLEAAAAAYTAAITIGAQPPVEQPLIYDTVR